MTTMLGFDPGDLSIPLSAWSSLGILGHSLFLARPTSVGWWCKDTLGWGNLELLGARAGHNCDKLSELARQKKQTMEPNHPAVVFLPCRWSCGSSNGVSLCPSNARVCQLFYSLWRVFIQLAPSVKKLCVICKASPLMALNLLFSSCLLQGNRGRMGVVIAAYMHYSNISAR